MVVVCSTSGIPLYYSVLYYSVLKCKRVILVAATGAATIECSAIIVNLQTTYPLIRLFGTSVSLAPHIDDTPDSYGDQKIHQHNEQHMKICVKKKLSVQFAIGSEIIEKFVV